MFGKHLCLLIAVVFFTVNLNNVIGQTEDQPSSCQYNELILAKVISLGMRVQALEALKANTTCDDEWISFQSSCYWFRTTSMDFEKAKTLCALSGGHLVSILNQLENDFVSRHISRMTPQYYWIGLTDMERECVWKWSGTDEEVHFVNWNGNEPTGGTRENCVVIAKSQGKWLDTSCT